MGHTATLQSQAGAVILQSQNTDQSLPYFPALLGTCGRAQAQPDAPNPSRVLKGVRREAARTWIATLFLSIVE